MRKLGLIMIPYLTACGALYHISYWTIFNINGLSLISVSDILKSAVQPLAWVLFILIYNAIMLNLVPPPFGENNQERKGIGNKALNIVYFSLITIFISIQFIFKWFPIEGLFFYGLITWLFISIYLTNNYYFNSYFESEKVRRFFIDLMVALPLIAFLGGSYNSRLIYDNLEYKYVVRTIVKMNTTVKNSSDTLKLLGITEDFFVFTPLNNADLIFMNKSDINDLVLKDKKRE